METNNYEKIINALVLIANEAEVLMESLKRDNANQLHITSALNIINVARNTIAFPRRNCDVGTAEDQYHRYEKFCCSHYRIADDGSGDCLECPLAQPVCKLVWAQMPYDGNGMK